MTKRITTFAIFTALMVVGGYIFYIISSVIPIPGSKFVFMGPYLTCVMMSLLTRYPKFGTLSLVNIVFGGVMIILSPWMTIAIVVSGIVSDLIMLLPIWMKAKQLLAVGIYNGMSVLTSFYVSTYITGNILHKILDLKVLIIAVALAVITGIFGGYIGLKLNKRIVREF